MRADEAVKLFGPNNLTVESSIRQIEREFIVDLGHNKGDEERIDQTYYPQFTELLRNEASRMSKNYEIFYCLENSIRELIVQLLEERYGSDWWDAAVPDAVQRNAQANRQRELSSGVTPRSDDLIDFTSFGELGEIIKSNWQLFDDMFRDDRAVQRILAVLNTLRAPIAHCKALAEDEELRLHLALRDWFRQME